VSVLTHIQCIASRSNTLQHTVTHCNTLQHTATYVVCVASRSRWIIFIFIYIHIYICIHTHTHTTTNTSTRTSALRSEDFKIRCAIYYSENMYEYVCPLCPVCTPLQRFVFNIYTQSLSCTHFFLKCETRRRNKTLPNTLSLSCGRL